MSRKFVQLMKKNITVYFYLDFSTLKNFSQKGLQFRFKGTIINSTGNGQCG